MGRGRFSVLGEPAGTAIALGRSGRRIDAEPDFVGRLRSTFEHDRLRRRLFDGQGNGPGKGQGDELFVEAPFLGGWVGYVAYEAQIDVDSAFPDRDISLPYPRAWFMRVERGVTVDHERASTVLWEWTLDGKESETMASWARQLERRADSARSGHSVGSRWRIDSDSLNREWYEASVNDLLGRIHAGEVYQVNLTAPVRVSQGADPLGLYLELRHSSPSDYSAFLDWPDLTVLASSPEQFFSLRNGLVQARPMKGTRPRSVNAVDDCRLRAELSTSVKDRAENLMIVDLTRNDLGRVATMGSVEVTRMFEVEEYATVFQMTSTVEARLGAGEDAFSLIAALFPPGSMTGAPKVQATRVIRQLEQTPRGIYSGCIGMLDWFGDASFNVAIRTLVSHPLGCSWAVGGGIVSDSEPSAEYDEAVSKIGALRSVTNPQSSSID